MILYILLRLMCYKRPDFHSEIIRHCFQTVSGHARACWLFVAVSRFEHETCLFSLLLPVVSLVESDCSHWVWLTVSEAISWCSTHPSLCDIFSFLRLLAQTNPIPNIHLLSSLLMKRRRASVMGGPGTGPIQLPSQSTSDKYVSRYSTQPTQPIH